MKTTLPLVLACTFLCAPASAQNTWHVDTTAAGGGNGSAGAPYNSIQTGIAALPTVSGDTILVHPGTYLETVNYLGKNLNLRSTMGAASTTIDLLGALSSSTVTLDSGETSARLEGFSIQGGTGTLVGTARRGGGIYCSGSSLTVVDCEVRGNSAHEGGAVYGDGAGSLSFVGVTIEDNEGLLGGGVHVDGPSTSLTSCVVRGNRVDGLQWSAIVAQGGGLWSGPSGTLTVSNSEFRSNTVKGSFNAFNAGGGIYCTTPDSTFTDCLVQGNSVGIQLGGIDNYGGGVSCGASNGQVPAFTGCTIRGNVAHNGKGGGVSGAGLLDDCDVVDNVAIHGGGVRGGSTMLVMNSTISGNSVFAATGECTGYGGGVNGGSYTNCVVDNNYAVVSGGGAYQATLTDCTIELNSASGNCSVVEGGGGIALGSATNCIIRWNKVEAGSPNFPTSVGGGGARSATLIDCEILENSVKTPLGSGGTSHRGFGGGAMDCQLTDCLVQGNTLQGYTNFGSSTGGKGGGVYGGSAENCQILDNQASMFPGASSPALGGGAASTTLLRCVLIGNSADHGGGAWDTFLTNCTLADNTAQLSGGALSSAPASLGGAGVVSSALNCILWSNSPDEAALDGGTINIDYSDVQGGFAGTNNINSDPQFWGLPIGDVQLRAGSPCIDAGNPVSPPDPDGSISDMGALPHDPTHSADPFAYCVAKLNSAGCLPSIGHTGTASLSGADDFFVVATEMIEQKPTILIWSQGSASTPFLGGTLCLAPPIHRTPVTGTGGSAPCTGVGTFHFSQSLMGLQGFGAGDRLFAQFWQRDPAHMDGTGVGLSNGLDFTLVP